MMSSLNREPVTGRMRRGADGSEQVKRLNVENGIKRKKERKKTTATLFHPQRNVSVLGSAASYPLSIILIFLLSFYPSVTLSPICFAFVLKPLWPSLWFIPPSLWRGALVLSPPLPWERTRVSAVTALVQRDNVCNSLPAPRCHSGGPFLYN